MLQLRTDVELHLVKREHLVDGDDCRALAHGDLVKVRQFVT